MFFHGFAHNYAVGVVVFERQGILALWSFVFNFRYVFENFHSYKTPFFFYYTAGAPALQDENRSKIGKIVDFAINNVRDNEASERIYDEICTAVKNMSASKTGALIVIEGETKLGDSIRTGTELNAIVTSALLENIFVPNTPLHDGAVIIRGTSIHSAGCFLPLTSNYNLSRELGTRHRAALGISEASDALIIVVSEETGKVSLAIKGSLTRNISTESLRKALEKFMEKEKTQESFEKIKFWKNLQNKS